VSSFVSAEPVFKWVNPSDNNSVVSSLLDVSVNITNITDGSVLIEFGGTNFTMQQENDTWSVVLDTNQFSNGLYNITTYFLNSTGELIDSDTLFNITVDNPTLVSFVPKLKISDLDVRVDGKTDKNLDDGDKIEIQKINS